MPFPIAPPVSPMLAKLARELPASGGKLGDLLYEPKWDGFRAIVFRDGDELEIGSRNEKPLTRYFPDLVEPLRANLPERCVVDGEVVIATEGGLDFDRLSLRIHPAESRVAMLAEETPAGFVAFDLLAEGDTDLRELPFRERRARLEKALKRAKAPVFLTPATTDRDTAGQWFDRFEGAGLDGVIAKPLDGLYEEGKRTMLKVKHLRTADCVVAGFRFHKDGVGVGSLLLGLYDDDGVLHHVGVASSFSASARTELLADLEPHRDGALEDHPWRTWAEADAEAEASAATPTRRAEPLERGQGPQLGAAPPRPRGRGRVRAPPGRPLPPHRALPALASRPRSRRRAPTSNSSRRCPWSCRRSSESEGIFGV